MTTQVALIDSTEKIDPALVQRAAVALNSQVSNDLPSCWPGIDATVFYLSSIKELGANMWPVFLVKHLPPGEGGFHLDKHNQPYSKVIANPSDESWTIDASHEIIEMLVDPYGNRMQASSAIEIAGNDVQDASGQFHYLVEAADPCEANDYAYQIKGVAVSDFITPNFYDAEATPGVKYSFRGNIQRPRQILPGGYISYVDLSTQEWRQILWVDPAAGPQYHDIGPASATSVRGYREWIHNKMAENRKFSPPRTSEGIKPSVLKAIDNHRMMHDKLVKHHPAWYGL